MGRWKNDAELFELMRERLYTPVAGDILDAMGYSRQFLPAYIMPLRDEMKLAGRACTVLEQNVFEPQKKPFGLLTEALDQLKRDEVYLATGAANSALWGELLTATAKARGAAGAVLDGYTGHASGFAAEFPGICQGPLGAGLLHPDQCGGFPLPH